MIKKQDHLWKGILEDVFDDFLRFMNPALEKIVDLSKGFIFLDKELDQVFLPENNEYMPKIADKLVKVFTHDGREEWILVHIEVQGQYRKDFSKRMFTYFYRIFDKYNKRITAYAIFTEANTIVRSDIFKLDFLGTSLLYKFNTYKIADQNDEELMTSENPFALIVLAAKTELLGRFVKDKEKHKSCLLNLRISLSRRLLSGNITKEKTRAIMNFIKFYVNFDTKETNVTFTEEILISTENKTNMGVKEEILEMIDDALFKAGIEEAKEKVIKNLILKLNLSDQQLIEVTEASLDFIKNIRSQIELNNTPAII